MIGVELSGTVTFRVFLPHASRVQVVGTFTDWRRAPLDLKREHPGWWSGALSVAGGDHQFCYLVDDSVWLADYAAHGVVLDPGGHWLSRLRVPGQGHEIITRPLVPAPARSSRTEPTQAVG
jgi:1,4-alpha-glucan branching enzyme